MLEWLPTTREEQCAGLLSAATLEAKRSVSDLGIELFSGEALAGRGEKIRLGDNPSRARENSLRLTRKRSCPRLVESSPHPPSFRAARLFRLSYGALLVQHRDSRARLSGR